MAYYFVLFLVTAICAWTHTGYTKVSKPFSSYSVFVLGCSLV